MVDVHLVAKLAECLTQLRDGSGRRRPTTSSISNSGALVYGAGRSDESTLSMLTPSSPSRWETDCMRPGWSMAQVLRRKGSAAIRFAAPSVRRPQLRVHVAAAAQGAEAVLQPAHGLFAAGDQHHHRELAAQVDHAAVLEVAPALGDVGRDLVDETRAVVADGGEHGVVKAFHARDSSGIAAERQSLRRPAPTLRRPCTRPGGIVRA